MKKGIVALLIAWSVLTTAIGASVVDLDARSFEANVAGSAETWLVEFFAPWCGHCKKLEPTYEKVAREAPAGIHVAKVDGIKNYALMSRFPVRGFPSIFAVKENSVWVFQGPRTEQALLKFATDPEHSESSKAVPWYESPFGPFGLLKGKFLSIGVEIFEYQQYMVESFGMPNSLGWFFILLGCLIATVMIISFFIFLFGAKGDHAAQGNERQHQD